MIKDAYHIRCNIPAERFGEAYPLGNGHMGAMVYGGFPTSKIVLSENTFFSGRKSNNPIQEQAPEAFRKMREYASKGRYDQVHEEAEVFISKREDYGTNLPVGELQVTYKNKEMLMEEGAYGRELDIQRGMVLHEFSVCNPQGEKQVIKEEVFVTHPKQALIYKINTDKSLDPIEITFCGLSQYVSIDVAKKEIDFLVKAYETLHCDQCCGVTLWGKIAVTTDGEVEEAQQKLIIKHASEVILYLKMKTDFMQQTGIKEGLQNQMEDLIKLPYDGLREEHIQEIEQVMKQCALEIEGEVELPFLFHYGRYLLHASSREDSNLPAHLQGIWNDNVACRIGWTCDMHLDINTQMNYWIAETTGLQQTLPPLFKWLITCLIPEGKKTAELAYGYPGWVGELVSNAWGFAWPYWASPLAPCPTGGVWLLTHMWEHYLYTQDRDFLKEEAFEAIREATLFFVNYVFEEEGYITCGPSISPENSFLYKGGKYQISNGCTYEILMIRELFSIYIQAYEQLCNDSFIFSEREEVLYGQVKEFLPRLLPYKIKEDGTLAEYHHTHEVPDKQHRHTSHLLGVYPFAQITPEKTPELVEAVEKTIEQKLIPEENWEDTGWARSLLALYEGRLQHGEKAYNHLRRMIEKLLEPNGMIYHPPTRGAGAFDHVYELDGNTGLTAAIVEMLVQSHNDEIKLLPALPAEWKNGSIKGIKLRGGKTLDMTWQEGKVMTKKVY